MRTSSETLQTLEQEKEKDEKTLKDLRNHISSMESLETARLIAARSAKASNQSIFKQDGDGGRTSRFGSGVALPRLQAVDGRVPAASHVADDVVARAHENAHRRSMVSDPCEDMKRGK